MVRIINLADFKSYPGNIYIHKNSDIAEDVKIGINCIIYEDVKIEEGCILKEHDIIRPGVNISKNCEIHDSCEIGYNYKEGTKTFIGENSVIRRGSTLYADNTFGKYFQTGNFAYIREKCSFGDNCSVGSYARFEGQTTVGKSSRFHSDVEICEHSLIGDYVWIFPGTILSNTLYPPYQICPPYKSLRAPIVENYAIISVECLIMPNIRIGKDSMIGAHSTVTKNVPEGELWYGNPARFAKKMEDIVFDEKFAKEFGISKPYPWKKSFKREGYFLND